MNQEPFEQALQELSTLPGVRGAFIGDAEGAVLAAVMRAGVPEADLSVPSRALARTLAGLQSQQRGRVLDLDLVFQQGRVLLRAFEDDYLAVLCGRQLNLPLLSMTLEEIVDRLRVSYTGGDSGAAAGSTDVQALSLIAREVLGARAGKVIDLLENASGSKDELSAAIERAEKITRLFIDQRNASEMAHKMRAALFDRDV